MRGLKLYLPAVCAVAIMAASGVAVAVDPADPAKQDRDPVGSMQMYVGSDDPGGGWLIADGRAVSRATYADLFASIGTTYGSGDGSTTFNLPDMRGRTTVGLDDMGGSDAGRLSVSNSLGATGGSQKVALTVATMPSHRHVAYTPTLYAQTYYAAGFPTMEHGGSQAQGNYFNTSSTGGDPANGRVSAKPHENMMPFVAVNYIIRASTPGNVEGDQDPVGSLQPYSGSSDPGGGWVLADGRTVSRSVYSSLFSASGTSYGSGDGSTTFNLPDLRGRVPVGLDNMGGSDSGRLDINNGLGVSGGAESVTLSADEMPPHDHTWTSPYWLNTVAAGNGNINNRPAPISGYGRALDYYHSSDPAGGGGAHNNLSPYITTTYIVKLSSASDASGDSDPVGSLQPYLGSSAPSGTSWRRSDGSALSRSSYASLFSLFSGIGLSRYGSGDGSTTFNLPDLRGRAALGLDNMGGIDSGRLSIVNNLGVTGGGETHVLTLAELPSHSHKFYSPYWNSDWRSLGGAGTAFSTGGGAGYDTTPPTGYTGGGGAHDNMQPYMLTDYLLKVKPNPASASVVRPASPTSAASPSFSVSFSSSVTGLTGSDFTNTGTAQNCSFSLTGSSSPYILTAQNCTEGTLALRLQGGAATDANGASVPEVNQDFPSLSIDRTPIAISWSVAPASVSNAASLSFQLNTSEPLPALQPSDISNQGTASGCSFSVSGSASPYTVTASSCSEGTVIPRLAESATADAAGNTAPVASLDAAEIMADSPAGYWPLDEASGPTVRDAAGANRTGTISGTASFKTPGPLASGQQYGMGFNGADTRVATSKSAQLNNPSAVTAEGWMKLGTPVSLPGTIVRRGNMYELLYNPTYQRAEFFVYVGGVWQSGYSATFSDSNWHHVAGSYDGSTIKLYVDGVPSGSFSLATPGDMDVDTSGSYGITIGASQTAPGLTGFWPFSGSLARVAVYSQVLSPSRIAAHAAASAVTVDRTPPVASFTSAPAPAVPASSSYGFSLDEDVVSLSGSDFENAGTATGCSFSPVAGAGRSYTLNVTGCSSGSLQPRLKVSAIRDVAGNHAASVQGSQVSVDADPPVVSWAANPASVGSSLPSFTMSLSEPVTGLSSANLSNSGSAKRCRFSLQALSPTAYRVQPWGCTSGSVVPRLASGVLSDSVGNTGPLVGSQADSFSLDTVKPQVAQWSAPGSPSQSSLAFTLSLSEPVSGLSASDISLSGSARGCQVTPSASSGQAIPVTVSGCSSSGSVSLKLKTDSVSDSAGNTGPTSLPSSPPAQLDLTPPSLSIAPPADVQKNRVLSFTLRFSEPVSGISASDFFTSGSTSGCSMLPEDSSGRNIVVRLSGCSSGSLRLSIAPGSVSDAAGNTGPLSRTVSPVISIPN